MFREALLSLFHSAVAAVHPDRCLPPHLPDPPPSGRLVVLGAGKAAGAMAACAERHYLDALGLAPDRLTGLATTRHGHARPTRRIEVVEAGHPVPDRHGLEAATRTLALAEAAGPEDLVLVLLSGGGSANWVQPVEGVLLSEKQALTRALLASGATIAEINTVRRHLSRIKGGRLAVAAQPAAILTLAISDVPGDEPTAIASGPTVPDASTLDDARAVLVRFDVKPSPSIEAALRDPRHETPKPGHAAFERADFTLVARPTDALEAVAGEAQRLGYEPILLGDRLEGEARDVARDHADLARGLAAQGRRAAILSGGELTVTLRGAKLGRGGPNQEYALALALALDGASGVAALAGDSDGIDGGAGDLHDPAGAFVFPDTIERARRGGLDPERSLSRNDSTGFFEGVGDLLRTGPTFTNANDIRVILVGPPLEQTATRPR